MALRLFGGLTQSNTLEGGLLFSVICPELSPSASDELQTFSLYSEGFSCQAVIIIRFRRGLGKGLMEQNFFFCFVFSS